VLKLAVLGLLKEQDLHGYELRKQLGDLLGTAAPVSFGSLYPALSKLEAAGAIRVVMAPGKAAGHSSTPAARVPGRKRRVYAITPAGTALFQQLLTKRQSTPLDERSFGLRLAFASYLSPERRIGLLEHRRSLLAERLAELGASTRKPAGNRYVQLLAEHAQNSLARDLSWLDRLITEERAMLGLPADN
jgi:DNA-binding PadR family transcriptional regulator